jgi:hypothetical protein
MAEAARRARQVMVSPDDRPIPSPPGREGHPEPVDDRVEPLGDGEWTGRDSRERRLGTLVLAVAALVLVATTALVVTITTHGNPDTSPPPTSGGAGPSRANPPPSRTPGSAGTVPGSTAPNPATGGAVPVLASVSPASGGAGQVLQVSGSGFLSGDGQIVARFSGQVAPTSCPNQASCTVTVPSLGASSSVTLTITTNAGTSNTLTFDYT